MKKIIFAFAAGLLAAHHLAAWDEPLDEDEDQYNDPDTTYLHDEAYWPTKMQDPFVDALMK